MTPRALRQAIVDGEWTCVKRKYPDPPPEWRPWRRDRMRVAIRCAVLFLVHGKVWHEVMSKVRHEKLLKADVTRSRMNQYVDKGMEFLLDRGVFKQVGKQEGRAK